jgi:CHAT domain
MPNHYDEFRVQITPNVDGRLALQILASPVPDSVGPKGAPAIAFDPADLTKMRTRGTFGAGGNLQEMQRIGAAVFQSVTNANVDADLRIALTQARTNGRRIRLVFSTVALEAPMAGVRPSEIPVEAIYKDTEGFYASFERTPVSRTLVAKPDRETVPITPPLRVLLVAASPEGWPKADVPKEVDAIKTAIKQLEDNRLVIVETCVPPTKAEMSRRLRTGFFHAIHFAGHGGIGRIGGDPTSRAFLCFEAEDKGLDPLDAFTFDTILRNCPSVSLVVITGCSTAALPTPIGATPYAATAFDGVAQRLVSPGSLSTVSAVVAMQFDLEPAAAVAFSRGFYTTLIAPDATIDEAVTKARSDISDISSMGSPGWVNPVCYWRCNNGRPFEVRPYGGSLSPEEEREILTLKVQIEAYRSSLQELRVQPESVQAAAGEFERSLIEKIEAFLARISEINGNAIRLKGGRIEAQGDVRFVLSARLRAAAKLDKVRAKISFEENAFDFVSATRGTNMPNAPLTAVAGGVLDILIENVSAGGLLAAGEYEIASILMKVKDESQSTRVLTIFELQIEAAPDVFYSSVDGYAFLSRQVAGA